jgi:hypothetical protein
MSAPLTETRTRFMNVDLHLAGRRRLDPLLAALGSKVFVIEFKPDRGQFSAQVTLASKIAGAAARQPDRLLRRLAEVVLKLPKPARTVWNGLLLREFAVSVQAGAEPPCHEIAIAPETLALVTRVGGRLTFATYGAQQAPQVDPPEVAPAI